MILKFNDNFTVIKLKVAHLLYFEMNPFSIMGALMIPLLMHDKSKFFENPWSRWFSSLISWTLVLWRFLLSLDGFSSAFSSSTKDKTANSYTIQLVNYGSLNKISKNWLNNWEIIMFENPYKIFNLHSFDVRSSEKLIKYFIFLPFPKHSGFSNIGELIPNYLWPLRWKT